MSIAILLLTIGGIFGLALFSYYSNKKLSKSMEDGTSILRNAVRQLSDERDGYDQENKRLLGILSQYQKYVNDFTAQAKYVWNYSFPSVVLSRTSAALNKPSIDDITIGLKLYFIAVLYNRIVLNKPGSSENALAEMTNPDVDELWHNFILDTQAYQAFCVAAFGSMVHHIPYGEKTEVAGYNEAMSLAVVKILQQIKRDDIEFYLEIARVLVAMEEKNSPNSSRTKKVVDKKAKASALLSESSGASNDINPVSWMFWLMAMDSISSAQAGTSSTGIIDDQYKSSGFTGDTSSISDTVVATRAAPSCSSLCSSASSPSNASCRSDNDSSSGSSSKSSCGSSCSSSSSSSCGSSCGGG